MHLKEKKIIESFSYLEYFPFWENTIKEIPELLRRVIQKIVEKNNFALNDIDYIAVTITAELSDAFQTKKEGILILNNLEIFPLMVNIGKEKYPKDILLHLKKRSSQMVKIEASKIAQDVGNAKAFNLVLLGKFSTFLSFESSTWEKVIHQEVPSHTIEVNLKAFKLGRAN